MRNTKFRDKTTEFMLPSMAELELEFQFSKSQCWVQELQFQITLSETTKICQDLSIYYVITEGHFLKLGFPPPENEDSRLVSIVDKCRALRVDSYTDERKEKEGAARKTFGWQAALKVLKVWSQRQHHLGPCWKYKFLSLTGKTEGVESSNLCLTSLPGHSEEQ